MKASVEKKVTKKVNRTSYSNIAGVIWKLKGPILYIDWWLIKTYCAFKNIFIDDKLKL